MHLPGSFFRTCLKNGGNSTLLLFKQVLHTHGVILSYIARYCKYFSSKLPLRAAKYFRQRGELPPGKGTLRPKRPPPGPKTAPAGRGTPQPSRNRRRDAALKGAWRAWSTFCHGVTAPPAGSTISARTPARLAASTSVSSLSPSMAVWAASAPGGPPSSPAGPDPACGRTWGPG